MTGYDEEESENYVVRKLSTSLVNKKKKNTHLIESVSKLIVLDKCVTIILRRV